MMPIFGQHSWRLAASAVLIIQDNKSHSGTISWQSHKLLCRPAGCVEGKDDAEHSAATYSAARA
jgi:hypothetical protein